MWLLITAVACQPGAAEPVAPAPTYRSAVGEALGTTWSVKWRDTGVADDTVRRVVVDALDQVDRRMSTYRPDSDLSRIRASDEAVPVAHETLQVVQTAILLADATGGAFDPTVQPLVELWGLTGQRRTAPPTEEELAEARSKVGWQRLAVGYDGDTPVVAAFGAALDLSAIAKGHAVDRVAGGLSGLGLTDHMVEVGGEVRVAGSGPSGLWTVGVDVPEEGTAPGQALAAVLAVTNQAVATSGNYRNVYDLQGDRVWHTLDPRTGRPAVSDAASATVVAPDCRTADGVATALMVLGSSGLTWVESLPDVDAMVLVATLDGFEQRSTPTMARYLRSAP